MTTPAPTRSLLDRVAHALKAAAIATLPPDVDAVDYDDTPTDEHRHVQVSVDELPAGDATATQQLKARQFRATAAAIAPTVADARLYLDLVRAAWFRQRIEVAPDLLTGFIKYDGTAARGYDDDSTDLIASYTFSIGAHS